MSLLMNEETQKAIQERQAAKLKYEIRNLRDQLINTMSYLDLAKDNRVKELYFTLDTLLVETVKTLKDFE